MTTPRSRIRGALLGLATGDAVGTTVEFQPRGSFPPVTDLTGGGPFHLRPGQWTDDTSMALCLARSLLDCRGFDPADQMRRYVRWWREGYLSSTGDCFDIGNTVKAALSRFETTGDPIAGSTDPYAAGNGSLMRLAPVVLYYAPDRAAVLRHAVESARTTHGAAEAVDACRLFADMLLRALAGASKPEVLGGSSPSRFELPLSPRVAWLAGGAWQRKRRDEIQGTGYVVRSLEAALWCFANTESFADAILAAANLGDDADTTAAITGQLAGAFYGEDAIPPGWRQRLHRGNEIGRLAEALGRAHPVPDAPHPRCYWASPGGLLAGAYPGDLDRAQGEARIRALLDAGVRRFVNLMEAHETDRQGRTFEPYEDVVAREAARLGVEAECRRFPVRDLSVPSERAMQAIQERIDTSLEAGERVYVHCWGGRGRTGTVVGVHLIRHGQADPEDFVDVIARRRAFDPGGGPSPENAEQVAFVRRYAGTR